MPSHLKRLLMQATAISGYDSPHTNWAAESTPQQQSIYPEYLAPHQKDWEDKDVLDIGCGVGWLLDFFKTQGARSIQGIEPSLKNIRAAKRLYPKLPIVQTNLMGYKPAQQYDFITLVMVLPHVRNLNTAFTKLATFMKNNAKLCIIVPDFTYFKMPRHGYALDIVDMSAHEYVVATTRPHSILTDIVRQNKLYVAAAHKAGLKHLSTTPILPTAQYRNTLKQYADFASQPIMQMLRFGK